MNYKKPLFITFEGCDGCGKTTQSKLFYEWFSKNYGEAILTREPGSVDVSEKIRDLLINPNFKICSKTELLLFEAARAQFVEELLEPSLKNNKSVICDRFFDSTMAYQGYGRGLNLNLNFIESLNKYSSKGIIPDLTFVIDVDEKNLARLYNRDYKKDRFDLEHLNFHRNVAEGFRRIAKKNLNLKRCVLIDYEAGVNIVQDKLREEFSNRYLK